MIPTRLPVIPAEKTSLTEASHAWLALRISSPCCPLTRGSWGASTSFTFPKKSYTINKLYVAINKRGNVLLTYSLEIDFKDHLVSFFVWKLVSLGDKPVYEASVDLLYRKKSWLPGAALWLIVQLSQQVFCSWRRHWCWTQNYRDPEHGGEA